MFTPFRTVAVLGAGVMGSQIAAHLANAGLTVHLLDLPASHGRKNDLVEAAYKKALKAKWLADKRPPTWRKRKPPVWL